MMPVACFGDECGVAASKQFTYVYFSLDGMTSQLVPNQLQLTRIMGLLNPKGWGHIVLGREAQRGFQAAGSGRSVKAESPGFSGQGLEKAADCKYLFVPA